MLNSTRCRTASASGALPLACLFLYMLSAWAAPAQAGMLPNDVRFPSGYYETSVDGIPHTFSHATAMVNGTRIHYVSVGGDLHARLMTSPTGTCTARTASCAAVDKRRHKPEELVVLLHGWPQSWYEWRHVLPELSRDYFVVALDLRGSCDSDMTVSGYEKRSLAVDVRSLVYRLGFSKVHLVGRGIGAMVAYAYAVQFPGEAASLVLLDSDLPGSETWRESSANIEADWQRLRQVLKAAAAGREYESLVSTLGTSPLRRDALREQDLEEYSRCLRKPNALPAGYKYFETMRIDSEDNQRFMTAKLDMPVLALAADLPGRRAVLEATRVVGEDVTLDTLPDTGPLLTEEAPAELTRRLLAFLAQVKRSR